jgi:hypothetical protein
LSGGILICRTLLSLCAISALAACHSMGDSALKKSRTCGLNLPPPDSGELASHGIEMRIFPRSGDMAANFTGCQSTWGYDPGAATPTKMIEARFENGLVVEHTNFLTEPNPQVCRYRNRVLEGDEKICPSFESANTREQSIPAGCLAKLKVSTLGSREPCFLELK